MKRSLFISLVLLLTILFPQRLSAKIVFGVEWGYRSTIYQICDFSFRSEDGMTLRDSYSGVEYKSNGLILAGIGFGKDKFVTTLNSGIMGIQDNRRVIPLSLRETWYFKGKSQNGMFALVDGGVAFAETLSGKAIPIGKVGLGWRVAVTEDLGINVGIAVEYAGDSPVKYYDRINKQFLYKEDLNYSSSQLFGVDFTLSINF